MLKPASLYKDQLIALFKNSWFEEKYKYYNDTNWFQDINIDDSTWNQHQFVSIKDHKIIGFITYSIDRQGYAVFGVGAINFTDDKITFGKDLGIVLRDIFEKFKFRKVKFSVVVGNPIEKAYDKLIDRYGGSIVGVNKKECIMFDGSFCDLKHYEIFKEEYLMYK